MKLQSKLCLLIGGVTACGGHSAALSVSAPTPAVSTAATAAATLPAAPSPASATSATATEPVAPEIPQLRAEALALPGATPPVSLDYLFYEPQNARVWVPAGGTGSVAVFDIAKREFARVEGFGTAEREAHGHKRKLGPSAGAIGDGFAYLGNRATQEICPVSLKTLKKGACLKLSAPTDGVEYVPSTDEVWVTTPSTQSLAVLSASPRGELKLKSVIHVDGEPEGYALDEARGLFLTNLEDKGTTISIDLKTHAVRDTWHADCSADGPRGIAVDSERALLLVACTDHVQALDMAHGGALLGKLDTGPGLDNIDYVPATRLLYAAAGKAARLTVARVGDQGELTLTATAETANGARNAVADGHGNVYVADPQGAHLLVLGAPTPNAK